MTEGKIIEVVGPVVDVEFEGGKLPEIYNAIEIPLEELGRKGKLVVEVAVHLGGNKVRCVAMAPTDGLRRGIKALDTGNPIQVPVGKEVLGRVINVIGEPVDQKGPIEAEAYSPMRASMRPSRMAAIKAA